VECGNPAVDLAHLKRKVDAGASFIVTQLFFDNRRYFEFVDNARAAGITVPIVPGIMPITNAASIERVTLMCGASLPFRLAAELHRRREDAKAVMQLGVAHATAQCIELLQCGVPGIHFYTLNRSTATMHVLAALRTIGYGSAQSAQSA
jgi:methylenetetrahydrofolate reductase (NADPH)